MICTTVHGTIPVGPNKFHFYYYYIIKKEGRNMKVVGK